MDDVDNYDDDNNGNKLMKSPYYLSQWIYLKQSFLYVLSYFKVKL